MSKSQAPSKLKAANRSSIQTDHPGISTLSSIRTHWAKWSVGAFLALFVIYRLATFVPEPIDSRTTLRPLLYAWFSTFVQGYSDYGRALQAWRTISFCVLFLPVILALSNYLSNGLAANFLPPKGMRRLLNSRFLWISSIATGLVLWRFPVLLVNELNPDETLFTVAARKLFTDPAFFRSVDCGTSGPLNVYPLMLPAIFGFSPDYASGRLINLIIVILSIYTLYRAFAVLVPDHLARIAILPLSGIFSVLNYWDLVHYSSEDVSLLILSLAIYIAFRIIRDTTSNNTSSLCVLGLLTSAAFFAKMQAVPLLLAVDMVSLACVYANVQGKRLWHPVAALLTGASPLPLLTVALCIATGQWRNFWMTYIMGNRGYVQVAPEESTLSTFIQYLTGTPEIRLFIFTLLATLVACLYATSDFKFSAETSVFMRLAAISGVVLALCTFLQGHSIDSKYFTIGLLLLVPGLLFLRYPGTRFKIQSKSWVGILAVSLLLSALFAIYIAHRLFPHYLLLLLIPIGVTMGYILIRQVDGEEMTGGGSLEEPLNTRGERTTELPFVLLFVTLSLAFQTYMGLTNPGTGGLDASAILGPPESAYIASVTPANGQIVVWGWNGRPYLGAGRNPATRDINMANLFAPIERVQQYYRARFLTDLRLHPPVLFIDAVGPNSCCGFTQQKDVGFELIPEISDFIHSKYGYLMSAYGERFYIRRDLGGGNVGEREESRSCRNNAVRCLDDRMLERLLKYRVPFSLESVKLPDHSLIRAQFSPVSNQDLYATVFSNESTAASGQGFQFQHVGGDNYRLAIGLGGGGWALSRPISLPQGKLASLSIELNGSSVTIVCNGVRTEEMHLSHPVVDSPGDITLGSWIGGQRPFRGPIQSFEIRDLGKE
jgi:hypothetical protein